MHTVTCITLCTLITDGVYVHRYTFFTVLYPVGVTGELLCLYAAQSYVANKKLWSLEMPNKLNFTFSYHYVLLFTMLLYIPRKFHSSVVMQSLLEYAQFYTFDILNAPSFDGCINDIKYRYIIYNKPTWCNSGSIVFIKNYKYALHVSDALCVHLQEHYKL